MIYLHKILPVWLFLDPLVALGHRVIAIDGPALQSKRKRKAEETGKRPG